MGSWLLDAGRGWVETRLAEVATLDSLGSELEDEPLEVHWMRLPAREKIAFDHQYRAGQNGAAQGAVTGQGGRMFLEDPGLRFALNARSAASQGFQGVSAGGGRDAAREVDFDNLDTVIAVSHRVN